MNRTFQVTIGELKRLVREATRNHDSYCRGEQELQDAHCPECKTLRTRNAQCMGWAPCTECGYTFEDKTADYAQFETLPKKSGSFLEEADDAEVDLGDDESEGDADESTAEEPEQSVPREHQTGDSLDAQVDKYFTDYEHEAQATQSEGLDLRAIARRLFEADDEPDAITAAGGVASQPGASEINVESFSNSVVRLIENPENLLEFRDTILKRAVNFLTKAHSPEVVDEFKRVMREQHDLEIGKSSFDVEDEYEAPRAGQAGPGGAA